MLQIRLKYVQRSKKRVMREAIFSDKGAKVVDYVRT